MTQTIEVNTTPASIHVRNDVVHFNYIYSTSGNIFEGGIAIEFQLGYLKNVVFTMNYEQVENYLFGGIGEALKNRSFCVFIVPDPSEDPFDYFKNYPGDEVQFQFPNSKIHLSKQEAASFAEVVDQFYELFSDRSSLMN